MKQELSTQLRSYFDAVEKHNETYSRIVDGLPVNRVFPDLLGLTVFLETGEVSDVPVKELKAAVKQADKDIEAASQAALDQS